MAPPFLGGKGKAPFWVAVRGKQLGVRRQREEIFLAFIPVFLVFTPHPLRLTPHFLYPSRKHHTSLADVRRQGLPFLLCRLHGSAIPQGQGIPFMFRFSNKNQGTLIYSHHCRSWNCTPEQVEIIWKNCRLGFHILQDFTLLFSKAVIGNLSGVS